jgi:hypothetical protein
MLDHWVILAHLATLDQPVMQAARDIRVAVDTQVHKETKVIPVAKAMWDLLDHRDMLDHRAIPVVKATLDL